MSPRELRRRRLALGLTQIEFGEVIGVTGNTVARWERAEVAMRPTTARLIDLLTREARAKRPRAGKGK